MNQPQLADARNQGIIYGLIHRRDSLIQGHTAQINLLLSAAGLGHKHLVSIISRSIFSKALALFRLTTGISWLGLGQQALFRRHGHLQDAHLHCNLAALNIGNQAIFTQGYNKDI